MRESCSKVVIKWLYKYHFSSYTDLVLLNWPTNRLLASSTYIHCVQNYDLKLNKSILTAPANKWIIGFIKLQTLLTKLHFIAIRIYSCNTGLQIDNWLHQHTYIACKTTL